MSWLHTQDGFELFCNRDERRTRGPELAPSAHELAGTRFLAPRDADAGGTWISVNERGLALCVLNGYSAGRGPARAEYESRGRLVWSLSGEGDLDDVEARLRTEELARYRTFELLALQPGGPARRFGWDGAELCVERTADPEAPLVSSGFEATEVRRRRRVLYERAVEAEGGPTRERLLAFHASSADGPSAYSVCMHREEAETRSFTHVVVERDAVRLRHTPGPPCRTAPGPELRLERVRGGAVAAE